MRKMFAAAALFACVVCCALARVSRSESSFGGIRLLDGYSATKESSVDTVTWSIRGKNGLVIHFESGMSEGRAVDLKDKAKFAWYREQIVNGHKVLVALVRRGVKMDPDLDGERGLPPGNILMLTFPFEDHRDHAANFVGKISNDEEMVDMLLMALTFNPSTGAF